VAGTWCYHIELNLEAAVQFKVELEQESDGRWIAEIPELPGVLTYGASRAAALAAVEALALRVVADRLEHNEAPPEKLTVSFAVAG
jgi:predicted RNase H-like HicB family nuclease